MHSPAKRLAPTLLPEGLGADAHLSVALTTQHPFLRSPELEQHLENALVSQSNNVADLVALRLDVCSALDLLCETLRGEWAGWSPYVHNDIRPIVLRRMVPFCKEFSFICEFLDLGLWPDYVNGLPMAGWAQHSGVLPAKLTSPTSSLDELSLNVVEHIAKMLGSVSSTGDLPLDAASWEKSKL